MEHSPIDILNVEFGNKALDLFLQDEKLFVKMLNESRPFRFCLHNAYTTIQKMGELPVWWRLKNGRLSEEAQEPYHRAIEWWDENCPNSNTTELTQCALVLNHFAEKRLELTAGV